MAGEYSHLPDKQEMVLLTAGFSGPKMHPVGFRPILSESQTVSIAT
jgi:hypothetical protein